MVYDRNSRGDGPRDYDYGRDGGGRDVSSSGGGYDRDDDYRGGAGQREYGNGGYRRYDQPNRYPRGQQSFGERGDYGRQGQSRGDWGGERDRQGYGAQEQRYEEQSRFRGVDDDRGNRFQSRDRSYGREAQGHDSDDRGFLQRAGDEVRSWFGDEEAERRREADARYEEHDRSGGGRHDDDYRQWRTTQVSQLDRDYHEYREENRGKFENEFTSWRTARQGQRDQLRQVKEHDEVLGSDGTHVGTVDKVREDRIILTKTDAEAGGRHHSIPSRWIDKVEGQKVTLSKTASEAKAAWEDEDRKSAMFASAQDAQRRRDRDENEGGRDAQGRMLNRSFSGTY